MWSKWDLRRVNYRTRVLSKKLNARFKRSFTFIFILLICLYLYMMIDILWVLKGSQSFFFHLSNTFESVLREKKERDKYNI